MLDYKEIVQLLADKKAENIVVMDMQNVTFLMDYMIVCDVDNLRLLDSITKYVYDYCLQNNSHTKPIQGDKTSGWQLIDASDIVIHLFSKEQRHIYQLDKLWKDCIIEHVS